MSPQTAIDVYDSNGATWVKRTGDSSVFLSNGSSWLPVTSGDAGGGVTNPLPTIPFDQLAGLSMALDAASPGTTYTDGAPATTWKATTGDATFTAPAAANAPTFFAATATDPAFLRFDGSKQRMTYPGTVLPSTGGYTMYLVVRLSQLGYGTIFNQGSTTSSNPAYCVDLPGDSTLRGLRRSDDGVMVTSGVRQLSNVWRVVSVVSTSAQSIAYRSNETTAVTGSSATTTAGVSTHDQVTIGSRLSPDADSIGAYDIPFLGDIAMMLTYAGAHDLPTIQSVERQLATRLGLTAALPSQGGTADGPSARRTAALQARSVAYGIPATNTVTGRALANFANTGVSAGVVPVPQPAGFTSSATNQVVTNKWFVGPIKINHDGVVFQNCVVYSTGDPKIDTRGAPGVGTDFLMQHCEVYGKQDDSGTGIGYGRYRAEDCYFHDCEDEFRLGVSVNIIRCLATSHSNGYLSTSERLHTDSVQSNGGSNPDDKRTTVIDSTLIAIRRNLSKGNSAVILATEGASVNGVNQGSALRRVTVDGCYLANGSYSLYIKTPGQSGSPGAMEDIVFTNNVFRGDALYNDMAIPHATQAAEFLTVTGNVTETRDVNGVVNGTTTPGVFRWDPQTQPAPAEVVATFDATTRLLTATWKQPVVGTVTVSRSDNAGGTGSSSVAALKNKYQFTTAIAAAATSATVTVASGAGTLSATITIPSA